MSHSVLLLGSCFGICELISQDSNKFLIYFWILRFNASQSFLTLLVCLLSLALLKLLLLFAKLNGYFISAFILFDVSVALGSV